MELFQSGIFQNTVGHIESTLSSLLGAVQYEKCLGNGIVDLGDILCNTVQSIGGSIAANGKTAVFIGVAVDNPTLSIACDNEMCFSAFPKLLENLII